MTKPSGTILVVLLVLLFLCSIGTPAQEYVLTVANEQLRFVAQPEAGYVVKTQEKTAGISALSSTLSFLRAENAKPIRGLDRHGVWVIEDKRPAGENEKTIKTLRANRQIEYAAPLFSSNGETVAVIPEIVIRVHPGVDARQVHFLCQSMALAIIKPMEFTTQEYLLQVLGPDAEAVFTAVEKLNEVDSIEWAAPNTAFQLKLRDQSALGDRDSGEELRLTAAEQDANSPGVFPNDEYFPRQWHLHNTGQSGGTPGADIRAPEAWEITTGDPNIVIAEFGGYVDTNHPDLVNNLVPGHDFVQPGSSPIYDYWWAGHSTYCAGIIAAQGNNGIGVTGVTWNCKVMPMRIWADDAQGHVFLSEAEIATAIRWAATNGADVMDNQWGSTYPLPLLQSAILDVTKPGRIGRDGKGCVVVFCSGEAPNFWYPARYPEVVSVGSSDHNDVHHRLTASGPELDIVAPDIWQSTIEEWTSSKGRGMLWTTDVRGLPGASAEPWHPDPNLLDYTVQDGATSIVSGVAALILSIEPNLMVDEVRHFLERSAKDMGAPGRDDYYGWGRVDARAALDMVLAKRADLNNDWKVDEQDLAILNAAIDTNDLSADIAPAAKRDGKVDSNDLNLMMQYLQTEIPEIGLIAHWKLDETEGTSAFDFGGHHGTLNGGPIWTSASSVEPQPSGGKIGGALQLDGINDYVSTPFILNPYSGAFSVFAWVKGGALGQVVISQKDGANWLLADSSGKLMTELKSSDRSARTLVSKTVITDGQWHRVGLSWDGSIRILYVDDVEVAKDTQGNLASSSNGLYIGAAKDLESGSFWSGLIDDVRIYDRAVTP